MKDLIIVAGLPGSGKTTWATKQVQEIGPTAVLVDDPCVDPEQWNKVTKEHEHVFVADPYFCIMRPELIRAKIEAKLGIDASTVALRWVCMENDVEKCLARARPRTEEFAYRLSKSFHTPKDAHLLSLEGEQALWYNIAYCSLFAKTSSPSSPFP